MQVFAVNSAVSFGRRNKENQTFLLPTAIVGAAGGAVYANQSKIKLDKDNFEKSMKTIEEKLDKTLEIQERFEKLKTVFEQENNYQKAQLGKLGITNKTTEISIEDLLKKYVDNDKKNLEGLKFDIEYVSGEKNYLLTEQAKRTLSQDEIKNLNEKIKYVEERTFVKSLVENAEDGKVKADDVRSYFLKQFNENSFLKSEMQSFSHIVTNFNRKRIGLFAVIGLIVGGAIGHMFKMNNKK